MGMNYAFLEEDELTYQVKHRSGSERQRPARRYSPRYQKQTAPANCRGGVHQRGSRKNRQA